MFIPVEDGFSQGLSRYRFYLRFVAAGLSTKARVSSGAASARTGELARTSPIPAQWQSPGDVRALIRARAGAGIASSPAAVQNVSQRQQITGKTPATSPTQPQGRRGARFPQGHELPRLPGWISIPSRRCCPQPGTPGMPAEHKSEFISICGGIYATLVAALLSLTVAGCSDTRLLRFRI